MSKIMLNNTPVSAKLVIKVTLASVIFAALIIWVQLQFGWLSLLREWARVSGWMLSCTVLMIATSHALRALRIYYAYQATSSVGFPQVAGVSLVHNTVSFLLPMRLGEIALPALSRYRLNIDIKYASATLFLIRIFDAHVLLILISFFVGNALFGNQGTNDSLFNKHSLLICIALALTLPLLMRILSWATSNISKLQFARPLLEQTRSWWLLYAITLITWIIKLFALALLAATLGNYPIDHAWIATIIADGSAMTPITGFANAGTFEAAFSLPLIPLGYNASELVKVAVNLHIFVLVTNLLAGFVGYLLITNAKPLSRRGRSKTK